MPNRVWIVVAALAIVLTGCSSSQGEQADQETAQATQEELLREWASGVCLAADDLAMQVTSVTDGLDVDLGGGLDQLPAIQEQVAANVEEIEAGIDEVQTALAAVPSESTQAQEFVVEMQGLVQSARSSGQEAVDLLAQAGEAGNVLSAGIAAAGAVAAAQSAFQDATSALDLLELTRTSGQGELGEAFASAPNCS